MCTPIRVLQVVAKMERNGYESRIMDIYRNIDKNIIQFDFYTHRKEKGDFDDEILKMGGTIYYNEAIKPHCFFRYLKNLDLFFKQHHYDIVHAHLNSYSGWVLLMAKKNGVKVRIAHSRNSGFDPGWKTIFKRASKMIINFPTTHRFACSKNAGKWLFGKTFEKDKNSRVIPNAFNCDAFAYKKYVRNEMRRRLGLREEIAIVNVGRLTYPKNHSMVFAVFRIFLARNPQAKLFLFGDGELKEQLYKLAESMGLSDVVIFMGNRPDVYKYLNAMDAMLFPSIYEGFGTVAIEAQCNGLPVLASDVLPEETAITDLIKFKSLKDSIDKWVDELESIISKGTRCDCSSKIKEAGYDMKINAINMQLFYLNVVKTVKEL